MVLHQPRKSGQENRALAVPRALSKFIVLLTRVFLTQLFISKTRLPIVRYHTHCIQKLICSNFFRTTYRVTGIRILFHLVNSFLCIFFSILMSLVLQRAVIGSGITEKFDGPKTVTTVAPSPGLRVLQQRIENIDTAGGSCETIVLQTDRTTLSRILFSIPESAIIDEFLAHVRLRCDHPSARLACELWEHVMETLSCLR